MAPWTNRNTVTSWSAIHPSNPPSPILREPPSETTRRQRFYDRMFYVNSLVADMRSLAVEIDHELGSILTAVEHETGWNMEDIDATAPFADPIVRFNRYWDHDAADELTRMGNSPNSPIDVDHARMPYEETVADDDMPTPATPKRRRTASVRAPKAPRKRACTEKATVAEPITSPNLSDWTEDATIDPNDTTDTMESETPTINPDDETVL